MKNKKIYLGILAFIMCISPSFAQTNVYACHDTINVGLNLLQNDVLYDSDIYGNGYCFAIGSYSILDCQGHTIDMNLSESNAIYVPFGSPYVIIKNCIIMNNINTAGIFLEYMDNNKVINTTFNNLWQGIVAEFGDNTEIIENHFYNVTQEALNFNGNAGNYGLVINNTFGNNGYDIRFSTAGSGYNFYNNKFIDGSGKIVLDTSTLNNWNTTLSNEKNILGYNVMGGNYWGSCPDLNKDGFCDLPRIFDGENTDYLALSGIYDQFYGQIPSIDKMILQYTINSCSGNSLNKISVYGFCTNTTCGTTNLTASQNCEYGCTENMCKPTPFQSNLLFLAIIIILVIAIIIGLKIRK